MATAHTPPTALVTGSTSGIGARFADRLAARGFDLVTVARAVDRLDQQAADLRHRYGCQVQVLPADLADREQCRRVELRLDDASRPVAMLVNNAGFGTGRRFVRNSVEDEERQLDVLVRAVMRLSHAVVPGMVARGAGRIVNVSSVSAFIPGGTYNAAKAWVTVFTEALAAQLAGDRRHRDRGAARLRPHRVPRARRHGRQRDPGLAVAVRRPGGRRGARRRGARSCGQRARPRRYKVLTTLARHAPRQLVAAAYRKTRPAR